MIIEVGNVLCRVLGASDAEKSWLQKYLSFEESGWKGQARGRRVSMFAAQKGTFPGGFLPLLREAAQRDSMVLEELDRRSSKLVLDPSADLAWLYDYQRAAVEACVRERRGIVRAPTGAGKGDMIVGLVKALPGRWLFLVHRDGLVSQQSKRYQRLTGNEPHVLSRTAPASWQLERGLNLMTLQTLAAGIRRDRESVDRALAEVDGVVVDECHVAPADVYFSAIQRCPAGYRLGFSGTPLDRTDNRSLMAIATLGKVIFKISAAELIAAGRLAAPRITMVQVHQKLEASTDKRNFHEVYDELIASSETRNAAVVELALKAPKPCMIFVKQIEHGQSLYRALRMRRVESEFVWGAKDTKAREAAIERLARCESEVMVASVVLQEGVDIPTLQSVVIASGGKSVIAALQRIGRGMRTDGGRKTEFEVFDVMDVGSPMMERHSRRRMNTYVREGYSTSIRAEDGTEAEYKPRLLTRRERRERMAGRGR